MKIALDSFFGSKAELEERTKGRIVRRHTIDALNEILKAVFSYDPENLAQPEPKTTPLGFDDIFPPSH